MGASGVVDLMRDRSGNHYAVKKMRLTNRREANRQIVRDLEYMLRAVESTPVDYIVRFHGYARRTFEAWIVMEVMDSCFGKLSTKLAKLGNTGVPENIIGALTAAVVKALHHLKTNHRMIHRDVRPTNILINQQGNIKLCDFGISRVLINSMAHTADAGNKYYLAPERVFPGRSNNYGIKSDVWSLGVTLVELARGQNPYADCEGEFAAGQRICSGPSPCLPHRFSLEAHDFVNRCLQKEEANRPNYEGLMRLSFFRRYENFSQEIVSQWVSEVLAMDA